MMINTTNPTIGLRYSAPFIHDSIQRRWFHKRDTNWKAVRKIIMLESSRKTLEDQAYYTLNQNAFVFNHPTQNKSWENDK